MSGLIKQNTMEHVIIMTQLRLSSSILLALTILLLVGSLLLSSSSTSIAIAEPTNSFELAQDETKPNIWDWGYTGKPNMSEAFSVWANVTDNEDGVGIRNVTINISGPNVTVQDLMNFNGSFYVASVDALLVPGEYWMRVNALDMNDNSRDSAYIIITIEEDQGPIVDPVMTLPIVVSTSLVLVVIVIVFALMYDRKQNEIGERNDQLELGT